MAKPKPVAIDEWLAQAPPGRNSKCIVCLNHAFRDEFRAILDAMARLGRPDLPMLQILGRMRESVGLPETFSVESATRHAREHEPKLWARAKGRA
ncbi:MAG TPA: hypothetical protein VEA38_01605 [Terriglobales bacterium]|nr:hypothetical protein [Terriglobales bacterium]